MVLKYFNSVEFPKIFVFLKLIRQIFVEKKYLPIETVVNRSTGKSAFELVLVGHLLTEILSWFFKAAKISS
jgi:hypothetical protein